MDFYDHRQASAYLNASVVMYKDQPIYVNDVVPDSVGRKSIVLFSYLSSRKSSECTIDSPDLNLNNIPLGMINIYEKDLKSYSRSWKWMLDKDFKRSTIVGSMYLVREPQRRWKVGHNIAALKLNSVNKKFEMSESSVHDMSNILFSLSFFNCVTDFYPSLKKATEIASQRCDVQTTIAFNKYLSVDGLGCIYYKDIGNPIGSLKNNQVSIYDNYSFLKETISDDCGVQLN